MPQWLHLQPDDQVYLISDISRLITHSLSVKVKFDPVSFIQKFLDALPDGNLFIPGFVNTLESGQEVNMSTLKPETGGLSKAAFQLSKSGKMWRTNDPMHSFFIGGKDAQKLADLFYDNTDTFGPNSVFGYLHRHNARIVMIDLDLYYGLTFAHYVEECHQVPYRSSKPMQFNFTDVKGQVSQRVYTIYAKKDGYKPILNSLEPLLIEAGAMKKHYFSHIPVFELYLDKAFDVIAHDIKNNRAKNVIGFDLTLYLKQKFKQFTRQ